MSKLCLGCMEFYEESLTTCPNCGYVEGTPAREAYHMAPGTVLQGRYLIGRVLGFGSFGVTYIGYDQKLKRKVAIKEYLPGEFSTRTPGHSEVTIYTGESGEQFSAGKEKFLEEARKLGRFRSEPEIIHIFDSFEENLTAYIVMEYMEGESLKDKLARQGALPVDEATEILLQMLDGLKKVHAAGMLHRDIAPDNIYVTREGKVKLFDFGAARFATTKRSRSLTVQIKSGYTPVEQYQSHGNQGPWTDVYAAAATYYKMLTNETPEDSMERKVRDRLNAPSRKGVKLKKSLENALMNALNVEIDGRTSTAEVFKNEILADQVKRVEVKVEKRDIGKWPLWVKAAIALGSVLVSLFIVLLVSGVIRFDVTRWGGAQVPEGKVRVPNLINTTYEEAKTRGQELKFSVKVQDKEYSDEIPVDRILSQTVQGGMLVDEGTEIGVTLSAGVEQTYVPDLVGLPKVDAEELLLESGLKAAYLEIESFVEPGSVVSQSLEADTVLDTGASIEISISKGMSGGNQALDVEVAELTGLSWEEAGEWATKNHCYLTRSELIYDDTVPVGSVIRQEPAAGSSIPQTGIVKLTLSGGAEKVFVPDVQYAEQADAEAQMENAGLNVAIQTEYSGATEAGKVIRQDVEANTRIAKGTTVTLTVSLGTAVPALENQQNPRPQNQNNNRTQPAPTQQQNQGAGQPEPEQPQQPAALPPEPEPAPPVQVQPQEPAQQDEITPEDLGERLNNLGV